MSPVGTEILFEAENYHENFHFSRVARPMALSFMVALALYLPFPASLLLSVLGIGFFLATGFALYLAVKRNSGEYVAVAFVLVYSFSYGTVYYFSSHVSGLVISSFAITLLALLFVVKSKPMPLLLAATLSMYGRVENFVLVVLVAGYLLYKKKLRIMDLAIAYILMLPNIEVARYWASYTRPYHTFAFGLDSIGSRAASLVHTLYGELGLLLILVAIGLFYMRKSFVILVPASLVLFLLFFQQYGQVFLRYLLPIFPALYLVMSGSHGLFKKEWILVLLFCTLSLSVPFLFFEGIEDDSYIRSAKASASHVNGNVALYGSAWFENFEIFYDDVTFISKFQPQYFTEFDYLVLITEVDDTKTDIEEALKMELSLVSDNGFTKVYKVDKQALLLVRR